MLVKELRGGSRALQLLLLETRNARVFPDVVGHNATISACEKAGQWIVALAVFDMVGQKRLTPTEFTFSSVISACEKAAQWEWAVFYLRRMAAELPPNLISYNAAASACEKSSRHGVLSQIGFRSRVFGLQGFRLPCAYTVSFYFDTWGSPKVHHKDNSNTSMSREKTR